MSFRLTSKSFRQLIFSNEILAPPTTLNKRLVTCEGSTLNIQCDLGTVIDVLRVNYGRQSKTECNSNGQIPASTSCVSKNSFDIVNDKCSNQQSCSVLAANSVFGDPCSGTFKYLEVEYQCISSKLNVCSRNTFLLTFS